MFSHAVRAACDIEADGRPRLGPEAQDDMEEIDKTTVGSSQLSIERSI